ncbi:MAG: Spy0128 family protein [Christensenellaceae bacterium]
MKKIGKLGLTIAMVLAMAIGTTATAFADTAAATVNSEATAISKTYTAAEAGLLTENSFDYELAYVNSTAVGTNAPAEKPTGTLPKAVSVAVENTNDTTKTGTVSYEELFDGISFSAPGYYNFTLKETSSGNPNIAYDPTIYNIQVQVVWDDVAQGTLKVAGITATVQGAEKKSDNAAFNNTPAATGSLTVTKTVAGNAANTDDEFEFTVTLSGVEGKYTAKIDSEPAEAAKVGDNVYTLKHGQTLTIENLPVGATYTVKEQEDLGGYDSVVDSTIDGDTTDGAVDGTIASGENATTFENTKNVNVITGVFMDVLPYALIVVVAAAACFFFMTRRRNREDY